MSATGASVTRVEAPIEDKRVWWGAVATLTLIAFGLRIYGAGESPAGDELTMYTLVHNRGFGSMMSLVVDQEKTPPLGFALAWLTSRIGAADTWMRAPEVLAGTALVPLAATFGRRAASRPAGLVAAGLIAVSPFLVFYGVEARSYSLTAAFTCASLLLLLVATERERQTPGVWAAWTVAVLAALMSHYTSFFVIFASVVWTLLARPATRKYILGATAATALLMLPWLPSFLTQLGHSGDEARRVAFLAPLGADSVWQVVSRSLVGHPLWSGIGSVGLTDVPGPVGLALILTGLGIGLVGAVIRLAGKKGQRLSRPDSLTILLLLTAVAAPVGLIIGSLRPHHSMLLPRNAITSLPSVAVLAGILLTRLPKPASITAVILVWAGLLLGSVIELRDFARPNLRGAAHAVEARWQKGDALLEAIYFNGPPTDLSIHLNPEQRQALQLTREVGLKPFEQAVWVGQTVFTITPVVGKLTGSRLGPPPGLRANFRPVWTHTWKGMLDVNATEWQPRKATK